MLLLQTRMDLQAIICSQSHFSKVMHIPLEYVFFLPFCFFLFFLFSSFVFLFTLSWEGDILYE
uniref:Uncharacterized protein n=1 Tax=Rhizophora mucronata TaxID=61149 RepID=A0A2P2N0H9_RHIMU